MIRFCAVWPAVVLVMVFAFAPASSLAQASKRKLVSGTSISINTNNNRQAISPYIYGYNGCPTGAKNLTFCRYGGNRLTAYNWENNYSNAGSDFQFQNDNGLDSRPSPEMPLHSSSTKRKTPVRPL